MTWLDFVSFLLLFILFVYVIATNVITQLHKVYLFFHFSMMIWPLGQVAVHMTDNPQLQQICINISFVGLSMLCFGWLLFTKYLTNHKLMLSPRDFLLLLVPSVIVVAGIIWNPNEGFMSAVQGRYEYRQYGLIFWLMAVMLIAYFLYSMKLLARAYQTDVPPSDRAQIGNALTGIGVFVCFTLLDLLINVVLARWLPVVPGLTSLGIVIADIYFVFSIQKHGMFDLVNIAQQDVADTLSVGVIVMDEQNVVIEKNSVVDSMFELTVGVRLDMVKLLQSVEDSGNFDTFLEMYRLHPGERIHTEIRVAEAGRMVYLSMHVAPVVVNQQIVGRVITVQDLTELTRLVEESNRQNEALQTRSRALLMMQDELYQANLKLELMAITDSLTGCYNRRYLMQHLEHEVVMNRRDQIPFALFLFDIDLFKTVNDTYGHLVGDEVIKNTSDVVRNMLRPEDMFARYGGEEFTIYLPRTTKEEAEELAHRIRSAVEHNEIETGKGHALVSVTISMGVLAVDPQPSSCLEDGESYVHEMFVKVDKALYEAKENGRNQLAVVQ
ncbi:histidine kinase N-terminal 7TM domain-containing diguanylate cyclase [Paenibacillus nasutitermitis]|nr:diguanylate cyclase [Paenibacillus nasutitermitis]